MSAATGATAGGIHGEDHNAGRSVGLTRGHEVRQGGGVQDLVAGAGELVAHGFVSPEEGADVGVPEDGAVGGPPRRALDGVDEAVVAAHVDHAVRHHR